MRADAHGGQNRISWVLEIKTGPLQAPHMRLPTKHPSWCLLANGNAIALFLISRLYQGKGKFG